MKRLCSLKKATAFFHMPFQDLIYKAHSIHRKNFDPNSIQISTLLSIKTGGCSENCSYCSQSAHHKGKVKPEPRIDLHKVELAAIQAKKEGATRLCMGAAWRAPTAIDLELVCDMIRIVKKQNLEACVTLGFLTLDQALKLKKAGLDYYNHNIDTSPSYYPKIVTTHSFEDRLKTLEYVKQANIKICCGGILGMGETNEDRIQMLVLLANLPTPPESVPINKLIPIPGTPLENAPALDPLDFVRTIALARILMPRSDIRLSGGRANMLDELQSLCFFAGANSIFCGNVLLTTKNPSTDQDELLFQRLGLKKRSPFTEKQDTL